MPLPWHPLQGGVCCAAAAAVIWAAPTGCRVCVGGGEGVHRRGLPAAGSAGHGAAACSQGGGGAGISRHAAGQTLCDFVGAWLLELCTAAITQGHGSSNSNAAIALSYC
jgi:hypothetical protein